MNQEKQKIQGITLIALVVTIIILLILAGVSIATLTGNNGMLAKATKAKSETKYNQDMEIIRMALSVDNMEWIVEGYNGEEDIFLSELQKTDEKAEVDYQLCYPDYVIVYYNEDYYKVDYETREISRYEGEMKNVAKIGNTEYETLQAAFDAVPQNNEETEIFLLKNISTCQKANVKEEQNIILQLENYEVLVDIENEGKLKITNGELTTNRRFAEGSLINRGEVNIESMNRFKYYICNYNTLNINTIEEGFGELTNYGIVNITKFNGMDYYNIYNNFENEGEIHIIDSNIHGFKVDNKRNIKIENTYLDFRPVNGYIISNEGKCEILGNTNITSKNESFGVGNAIIINKEGAEFVMSGGCITGDRLMYNNGIVRMSGNTQAIGTGFYGIENQFLGEIYISGEEVYIKSYLTGIKNDGKIEMISGKIEATSSGDSKVYAIYNNNNKDAVVLGESAITLPKNYNVD